MRKWKHGSDHMYLRLLLGNILVRLRLFRAIRRAESITSKNKNWKMTDSTEIVLEMQSFDLQRGN